MKEITVEYKYTVEEAVVAAVEVTKSVNRLSRFTPWLGWIVLSACAVDVVVFHKPAFELAALIVIGVFFAAMPLIVRWSARRRARKLPSLNNIYSWHISDAEIKTSTDGAESRFVWDKIIKIHERKMGFLIFTQPRLARWLPKSGFQSESDIEEFRNIAKSKSFEYKG